MADLEGGGDEPSASSGFFWVAADFLRDGLAAIPEAFDGIWELSWLISEVGLKKLDIKFEDILINLGYARCKNNILAFKEKKNALKKHDKVIIFQ